MKPEGGGGAEIKFPNIPNNGIYENQNKLQKVPIKRNTSRMDYPNLRARRFNHYYEGETFRKINELSHKYLLKFLFFEFFLTLLNLNYRNYIN